MSRRMSLAIRLVALLGIAGGLSGCAIYGAPGYRYGYAAPGYYRRPAPVYRPYGYRPYDAWNYGHRRPFWGRPYRSYGYYDRPFW